MPQTGVFSEGRRLYFAYFAALGAVFPFLVLYLEQNGLTPTQIGLLSSIAAGVAMLPGLLWVAWSDRVNRTRSFMLYGFGVQLAIWLIYPMTSRFYQFLLLMMGASFLVPPVEALMNVWVLGRLDRRRLGSGYALVRIWGSIGWILSTVLTGALIQATEIRAAFLFGAGLLLACMLLPFRELDDRIEKPLTPEPTTQRGMTQLLSFGTATIIRALSAGMSYTFLAVYLDRIGTPFWLMGWGWAISATPEIPIMVFAGRLSDRIGRIPLLVAGCLCSSLMAFAFAAIGSPLLAVALMSLSGVSYGLTYISSVGYLADFAPRHRQATAQGVYAIVSTQLPRVAGPFMGGLIIDTYGLSTMFVVSGGLTLLAAIVILPAWKASKVMVT